MPRHSVSGPDLIAIVVGIVIVSFLAIVAYAYVGWLGLGIVGLFGLVISVRTDMAGDRPVIGLGHGSGQVPLLARQMQQEDARTSPEEQKAKAAARARLDGILYVANTICIALMVLGFGMFFMHQL